ncbi:MAG: beta-propeller fold lactonase family protein [Planctomycetota bacterium]
MKRLLLSLGVLALGSAPLLAQHSQVSSVVVNPAASNEVWVCNRGNNSVSVIDTTLGAATHEIEVGVWPRTLAFSPDGTQVYVANQRGNVPVDVNFVTPFTGAEIRGTVSVIDVATKAVTDTLTDVGTEPYGLAFSPNGKYFALTSMRSATLRLFDAVNDTLLETLEYPRSLNIIPVGTVTDVDSDLDMVPDLAEPRAFVIRDDSARIYVTHLTSGFVSTVDVQLSGMGMPTGVSLASRIDLNDYDVHPILNPIDVQTVESQGFPRFADDIALSPDGTLAIVPHVLHNTNHDVNHDFAGEIDGDFANRVYPALTVLDAALDSYGQVGDNSARLHHEYSDPVVPAEYVPYGGQGATSASGIYTLGGVKVPLIGGTLDLAVTGTDPTDVVLLYFGTPVTFPLPGLGTLYNLGNFGIFPMTPSGTFFNPIQNNPIWDGLSLHFQAVVTDGVTGEPKGLTNGLEVVLGLEDLGVGDLGYRAGQPGRVLYNPAGDRALMLNRGSEDIFLYRVVGPLMELHTAFPERHDFVERAAFDATTPLGDLPLGMAMVDDPTTGNDDALVYVVNETSRTLSTLRVDWTTYVITQEAAQIPTLLGADKMTLSERSGQELFEDASRAQTAGLFNNSCGSCHFEGGADANVWQRPAGPRSTMPMFGGTLATGLLLWKGTRLNLGETGPMFGGENGGHGILTDSEQQALIDYHEIIPVPLNPNLDPVTGAYSANAALGEDLFFGNNSTGLNPTMRHAGCFSCHPDKDSTGLEARGYTADFLDPTLTADPFGLETLDPLCISLQENIVALNIRNVNSGVNVDLDNDGSPDVDRNLDGWSDLESYTPLNADADDDFMRDDPNGWLCPEGGLEGNPLRTFFRAPDLFSIPTKLGVFSTGPYFHDHSVVSLRTVLDPAAQQSDPVFGHPSYPALQKFFNEFHDIRGHEDFVPGASKVQVTLQTLASGSTFDADIQALLEYISSL